MILKCLLTCISLVLLRGILFSQESSATNLEIIGRLLNESFTPVSNKLLILGDDNLYQLVFDDKSEEGLYIFDNFKRNFDKYKLIIGEDSDSVDYKLVFRNPSIRTNYKTIFTEKVLGTKKVQREVVVSYDIDVIDKKNSSVIYDINFSKNIKDSFDLDKLNYIEDKRYLFSRSSLPAVNNVNEILYPLIILTASAAAIILFFIIRSK